MLGGAISAPVAAATLARASTTQAGAQRTGEERAFSPDQLRLVGALAERVLPRTDTPGALQARVDLYIETIVSGYFSIEDRETYLRGLGEVARTARERFGLAFEECPPARQDELVAELDRLAHGAPGMAASSEPDQTGLGLGRFFRFHKELTVVGYYTSEVGQTQELRPWRYGEYDADLRIGPDDKAFA